MNDIYPYPGAQDSETYEWENRIADPEGRIEAVMGEIVPFEDTTIIDIGAGSAFHALRFAETAEHVYAIEPAPGMLRQAHRRLAEAERQNVSIINAGAEDIPLRDGIAEVIHSRFAYFFGPETEHVRSCEPGIREAKRLLKLAGAFFVIDNDLTQGEFASFLGQAYFDDPASMQEARDAFWSDQGFEKHVVESSWTAPDREVLRRVISMEFPANHVNTIMEQISGSSLSYVYDVYVHKNSEKGSPDLAASPTLARL